MGDPQQEALRLYTMRSGMLQAARRSAEVANGQRAFAAVPALSSEARSGAHEVFNGRTRALTRWNRITWQAHPCFNSVLWTPRIFLQFAARWLQFYKYYLEQLNPVKATQPYSGRCLEGCWRALYVGGFIIAW